MYTFNVSACGFSTSSTMATLTPLILASTFSLGRGLGVRWGATGPSSTDDMPADVYMCVGGYMAPTHTHYQFQICSTTTTLQLNRTQSFSRPDRIESSTELGGGDISTSSLRNTACDIDDVIAINTPPILYIVT